MNKYPVNAVLTRNVTSSVKTSIRKNIFARYILSYRGFVLDKKRDTNLFLSFKFFFFFSSFSKITILVILERGQVDREKAIIYS